MLGDECRVFADESEPQYGVAFSCSIIAFAHDYDSGLISHKHSQGQVSYTMHSRGFYVSISSSEAQ